METEYIFGYGSIRTDMKWYGRVPWYVQPVGFGTINHSLYRIQVLDFGECRFYKYPNYFRELIDVELTDGIIIPAWVYFAHPMNVKFIKKIKTGNWKDEIFKPKIRNKKCKQDKKYFLRNLSD